MMRATAAGSLPGKDFIGAARAMLELFPDAAPLPELPGRGPGAAMIGRAGALLEGLAVELTSSGWRVADHQGRDHARARALWRRDLDELEELAQAFTGTLKIGVSGPLTLAASLTRVRAEVMLVDPGARRDVAQSLFAGLENLRAELARRLPNVGLQIQIDEPMLPMILDGTLATSSGLHRIPAIGEDEASMVLKPFASGAWLHCCGAGEWLRVASRAGFAGVYADTRLVGLDALSEWADTGGEVIAGIARTDTGKPENVDDLIRAAQPFLALGRAWLAPACGLALWSQGEAAQLLRRLVRAAKTLESDG